MKVDGTYHLFTSEMVGDPIWVRMKLGYWTSRDRLTWTRAATIRESSAEFTGADPRAALWSPLPVWDETANRWNLFYVAYRSKPGDGTAFTLNYDGRIWRAISKSPGMKGVGGPYEDVGVVMQPGTDSLPWEGLQGTDSFFPWHVGKRWYAMYGSAQQRASADQALARGSCFSRRRSPGPGTRVTTATVPLPIEVDVHREPHRHACAERWLARCLRQQCRGRHRLVVVVRWRDVGKGRRARRAAHARLVGERRAHAARTRGRGRGEVHGVLHGLRAGRPTGRACLRGKGGETCAIGFAELKAQ